MTLSFSLLLGPGPPQFSVPDAVSAPEAWPWGPQVLSQRSRLLLGRRAGVGPSPQEGPLYVD